MSRFGEKLREANTLTFGLGFRTTKGALKLHLLLDHDGFLPCYAVAPKGKVHEIQVARKRNFQPGTMLVFDRGYTDYQRFGELTGQKVGFVTRLKDKAAWVVVEQREVSEDAAKAAVAERRTASPPPAARNCVLASEQLFQSQDTPGASKKPSTGGYRLGWSRLKTEGRLFFEARHRVMPGRRTREPNR